MKESFCDYYFSEHRENLAGAIIFTAMRLEHVVNRSVFEPLGLTSSSVKIIGLLKHRGQMTSREISEFLGSSKSNITQRLNFLQKNGLIRRLTATNLKDGRKIAVELTDLGLKKIKALMKIMKGNQVRVENCCGQREINLFLNLFKKINEHLDIYESSSKSKN